MSWAAMTHKISIKHFEISLKTLGKVLDIKWDCACKEEGYALAPRHLDHHRRLLPHPHDGSALHGLGHAMGLCHKGVGHAMVCTVPFPLFTWWDFVLLSCFQGYFGPYALITILHYSITFSLIPTNRKTIIELAFLPF